MGAAGGEGVDIGIYSHNASPMVYCADNRLSFVQARIDTIASTPDTLARVDINFEYTARDAEPLGLGLNPHHYNYYLAHCPEGVTLTPSYNRVVYPGLYENTDLHVSGNNSWMKFEFVIHPGGDPEDITMTIAGADNVVLIEQLGLVIVTSSLGNYVFPRPAECSARLGSRPAVCGMRDKTRAVFRHRQRARSAWLQPPYYRTLLSNGHLAIPIAQLHEHPLQV